jgi:exonuclease VII large subunit
MTCSLPKGSCQETFGFLAKHKEIKQQHLTSTKKRFVHASRQQLHQESKRKRNMYNHSKSRTDPVARSMAIHSETTCWLNGALREEIMLKREQFKSSDATSIPMGTTPQTPLRMRSNSTDPNYHEHKHNNSKQNLFLWQQSAGDVRAPYPSAG